MIFIGNIIWIVITDNKASTISVLISVGISGNPSYCFVGKIDIGYTKNRVAIKPKRIMAWYSDDLKTKSLLINTIAHEITHTVSYTFSDSGHGTKECPDEELVSYGIGNLVAKMWREK